MPKKMFLQNEKSVSIQDATKCFYFRDSFLYPTIGKELKAHLYLLNSKEVISRLTMDNLEIKGAAISGDMILKGRIFRDKEGRAIGLSGKIVFENLMFNHNLLLELKALFKVSNGELKIYSLTYGKSYGLRGRVSLKEPFESEFTFEIVRANIKDIAVMAKAKNPDVVLGIMNGVFNLKGPLFGLSSKGILEGKYGKIGPIRYDMADIRFEGLGPIINITKSTVKQGQATFTVEGYLDMRKIAGGNIFDSLKVKSDMKTVVWDGWDISKNGSYELSISKDLDSGISVGFKTGARETLPTYSNNREKPEEMSLEYRLGQKESFSMKIKDNEEFFGIQHKTKF